MQFDDMTEQERLVWAATYGAFFVREGCDRGRRIDPAKATRVATGVADMAVEGLREMEAEDDG